MSIEQYKQRMAEMGINRENLEAGLPAENNYDKLKIRREAAHLPPWFKAVLPPPPRRKTSYEKIYNK